MRYVLAAALALLTGCSIFQNTGSRDPVAVGRTLGTLTCTVALTERPEVRDPLASALFATQAVVSSESPSLQAIAVGLSAVKDVKVRAYAASVVAVALALFPDNPKNADDALTPEVKDAILAAIAGCNTVLGATAPTTTTSTTIPPPPPNP